MELRETTKMLCLANALLGDRHEELAINYRNTLQIQNFALNLTDKDRKVAVVKEKKYTRQGSVPDVIYSDSMSKTAWDLATKVEKWLEEDKVLPEEIAIIYPSSEGGEDSLVYNVIRAFKMKNIKLLSHYADSERIASKFPLNEKTILPSRKDGLKVDIPGLSANFITAFSSQGMSYRCVAVLMDNFDMEKRWNKEQTKNLQYIALTRATHELALVFGSCDTSCSKALVLAEQIENQR